MAIDSLGSSTAVSSFSQYSISSTSVAPAQGDSDGDGGAARIPPAGGRFASAIEQTLAQLGGGSSANASTSASSPAQDPAQAEHAFAQSLFSALQSQFGSQQQAQGAQGEGGGSHHHHHGGGGGRLAGALENLAQSLTASPSPGGASSSAASDLQTSFNNLLAASGQSGSSASLPQFLQSLAQNLQGGPNSGNLLSVKV